MSVTTKQFPAAGALDTRVLEVNLDPDLHPAPLVGFVLRDSDAWHEGLGITAENAKALAWAILEEYYDVDPEADGGILVSEKTPEPEPLWRVEVGQFYRVVSTDTMMKAFQDNPIVQVASVAESNDEQAFFSVKTNKGVQSSWHLYRGEEPSLVGPIRVKEQVTTRWVEV